MHSICTFKGDENFYGCMNIILILWVQSQGRFDLLENCHLCLPSFHAYGHKVSLHVWSEGLIKFERAFDAPVSREAMCASQRALP